MSLLIDALRKAEQAKRDAGQATSADARANPAAAPPSGSAEPPPRAPQSAGADLAEAYLSVSPGAAHLTAARPYEPPPATSAGTAEAAARSSVRVLFDAKAAPVAPPLLPIVAAVGALGALAIGGWVWWEMQPHGSLSAAPTTRAAPAAPSARGSRGPAPAEKPTLVATVSQAQGQPPLRHPALPATPPAPSPSAVATTAGEPAASVAMPSASPPPVPATPSVAAAERSAAQRRPTRGTLAAARPDPQPAPPPPLAAGLGPIRRGAAPPGPPPKLTAAYAAYGEGRLDEAGRLYREVLAEFPLNRDAINGLAATALRAGRADEAERWFRRALTVDPRDPVAVAGLANLTAAQAPIDTESRLKTLLAATPDAAPFHFALGNVLAVQQRWSEAQQAYFRAYALDGDNPDYLFNLAVSLDHLGQAALARRFYGEALAARGPAAFDPAAARARLEALAPP